SVPTASPPPPDAWIALRWCGRVLRTAASSRPSTKLRASRAASNMSSRNAASRSGISAIDCFSLPQDGAPPDIIAARLHRLALDEIDRPPQQLFQRFGESEKSFERRQVAAVLEFDQKIEIAPLLIKIH